MPWIIHHHTLGTFIGLAMGLAFWSRLDTAGQSVAVTFKSREEAETFLEDMGPALFGNENDDVELFEVPSGHWRDLLKVGLHIGDMAHNEVLNLAAHDHHHSPTRAQPVTVH